MSEELKQAGAELVRITGEVKSLREAVRNEELLLVDQEVIPEENEKRLKDINVALNRAIAEQERIQSDYDALVAEFKQGVE